MHFTVTIKDINKEITIYTFGYEEESPFVKFVKQYTAANSNIKWLMLNNETNLELMQEIGDSYNSTLVIVMSGDKRIGAYRIRHLGVELPDVVGSGNPVRVKHRVPRDLHIGPGRVVAGIGDVVPASQLVAVFAGGRPFRG